MAGLWYWNPIVWSLDPKQGCEGRVGPHTGEETHRHSHAHGHTPTALYLLPRVQLMQDDVCVGAGVCVRAGFGGVGNVT